MSNPRRTAVGDAEKSALRPCGVGDVAPQRERISRVSVCDDTLMSGDITERRANWTSSRRRPRYSRRPLTVTISRDTRVIDGPLRLLADRFYLRMFGKGYIRNADEIERSSVADRDSRR